MTGIKMTGLNLGAVQVLPATSPACRGFVVTVCQHDTKEYINQGYLNQSFAGVRKRGIKGEVKRGKGAGKGTGREGERGGKNEGKRVGGNGSNSTLENSNFGTPLFSSLVAFQVWVV